MTSFRPAAGVATRTLDGAQAIFAGPLERHDALDPARAGARQDRRHRPAPGVSMRRRRSIRRRWPGAAAIASVALEQMSPEADRALRRRTTGSERRRSTRTRRRSSVHLTARRRRSMLGGAPATLTPGATGPDADGALRIHERRPSHSRRATSSRILPGSDPALRGQYVSLTAHNDHVGFDHVAGRSRFACARSIASCVRWAPTRRRAQRPPTEWATIRTILDSLRRAHPRASRLDSQRRRRRRLGHRLDPRDR